MLLRKSTMALSKELSEMRHAMEKLQKNNDEVEQPKGEARRQMRESHKRKENQSSQAEVKDML